MQGLGGLAPGLNRGATMSGNKPNSTSLRPLRYVFNQKASSGGATVSTSYTAEEAGLYDVAIWGAGGGEGATIGGGGELALRRVRLSKADVVSFVVGAVNNGTPANRITSATFPDGNTMTANGGGESAGGTGGTGPVGTRFVAGSAGVGGTAGQAGSYEGFTGGLGLSAPGGGGQASGNTFAGAGGVMIVRLGD